MAEAQLAAVEPYQERGLRPPRTDAGDVVAAIILYKAHIILHVSQHGLAPRLTLLIGRNGSDGGKQRGVVHLVGRQPMVEARTNLLVRHDGVAAHDTRDVERLRRRLEGDAVLARLIGDRGKRHMLMPEDGHVAMNLVADDEDVVAVAEVGQPDQRLTAPADARRVVGIAEDEHAALVIGHLLEVVEVHLIRAVVLAQRVVNHLAAVALGYEAEGMIHRRLDDDLLVGAGEDIDDQADTFDDAGDERQPLALDAPLMVHVNPVDDARPQLLRHHGVAEERMLHALLQGVGDEGRRLKIHIGHPQGQQVVATPSGQKGAMFQVTTTRPVDNLVEIIATRRCSGMVQRCIVCHSRKSIK